jgi:bifunctional DNA-binding transcriptional regulator/antitoxin component of YhaV-PrlF toxin-antitoxin module
LPERKAESSRNAKGDEKMRISAEGFIEIPEEIRRRLNLTPEAEIEFEIVGDALKLRKAPEKKPMGKDWIQRMSGAANTGMITDEIMAMTRGE